MCSVFPFFRPEAFFHNGFSPDYQEMPDMPENRSRPFPYSLDLFCRVVDNFGDIGVCWRLACDLAARGVVVRLWVDCLQTWSRLYPAARNGAQEGWHEGVEVRHWDDTAAQAEPADVVIEAFACELPEAYVQAMARRSRPPVWLNLEYLSAEDWVAGCHRMASPHPRLPLTRHFFFPGFDRRTGGLIREPGLLAARERFIHTPGERERFLHALGVPPVAADTLRVSLFAYEQPALPALLQVWQQGAGTVQLLVPEGRVCGDVAHHFGGPVQPGERVRRGNLEVCVLRFMSQADYDRLLWSCDLNFVRGEDSFVRAQWAGKPMVWQVYRQQDDAHRVKLDAFLERYLQGGSPGAMRCLASLWALWNAGRPLQGEEDVAACAALWTAFQAVRNELVQHAAGWCDRLAGEPDLATNLMEFSEHMLK